MISTKHNKLQYKSVEKNKAKQKTKLKNSQQ